MMRLWLHVPGLILLDSNVSCVQLRDNILLIFLPPPPLPRQPTTTIFRGNVALYCKVDNLLSRLKLIAQELFSRVIFVPCCRTRWGLYCLYSMSSFLLDVWCGGVFLGSSHIIFFSSACTTLDERSVFKMIRSFLIFFRLKRDTKQGFVFLERPKKIRRFFLIAHTYMATVG